MPGQAVERVRAGVVGPVVENPRSVRALVVGRLAIEPVRQLAGGVARVVERNSDDLIETNEVVGGGPCHRRLRGRRHGSLLNGFHGYTWITREGSNVLDDDSSM